MYERRCRPLIRYDLLRLVPVQTSIEPLCELACLYGQEQQWILSWIKIDLVGVRYQTNEVVLPNNHLIVREKGTMWSLNLNWIQIEESS